MPFRAKTSSITVKPGKWVESREIVPRKNESNHFFPKWDSNSAVSYHVIRRLMRKTPAQRRNPPTPTHMVMRRSEARRKVGSGSGAPRERWNQAPSRPTKPMRAVAAPNIKPAMMRTKLKLNNGPPPQCLA